MPLRRHHLILCGILVLGFLLRVWGIDFGLPHLYHADEPALVNHAMAHGGGDLNPHYFKLPPLLGYYLFFWFGLYYLLGGLVGWFASKEAFALLFFQDPTSFYLIARIASGLFFGTLGIYLVYRLASRLFSKRAGLMSAFFVAVCFLHVRDSHYVIYDMPLATGLLLSFLALERIVVKGHLRHYVLFGLVGGLTTAAKYNGALIGLPFLLAHCCNGKRLLGRNLWIGLAVMALSYAVGNPFSLIDFKTFWGEFWTQAGAEGRVGLAHHLSYSLREGMGLPLLALGLLGTIYSLVLRNRGRLLMAFFILLWLFYISVYSQPYERYALPVIAFLCIAGAGMLDFVLGRLRGRAGTFLLVAVTLLAASSTLAKSLYADLLFTRPDTRTVAKQWLETHLAPGSKIALDYSFHQPRLHFTRQQLQEKYSQIEGPHSDILRWRLDLLLEKGTVGRRFEVTFLYDKNPESRTLFARPVLPFDVKVLTAKGIQYVLIARLTPRHEHSEFYEALRNKSDRIKVFHPYRDKSLSHGLAAVRQTGAATESADLFARECFGDILEVFKLKPS